MKLLRRFYLRQAPEPCFEEDYPTVILLGRWLHLYNTATKKWSRITETPKTGETLARRDAAVERISLRQYLGLLGWHGFVELVEDVIGRRWWSPKLDRRRKGGELDCPRAPFIIAGGSVEELNRDLRGFEEEELEEDEESFEEWLSSDDQGDSQPSRSRKGERERRTEPGVLDGGTWEDG